jgi:BrnA antitoxin of type II toxin-antitoxin system
MRKEYDFSNARRGPVLPVAKGKTRITIRLDDDVLEWFREQVHDAGGGNYQTLINNALRQFIEHEREPLETVVRRVVREELAQGSQPSPPRPRRRRTRAA